MIKKTAARAAGPSQDAVGHLRPASAVSPLPTPNETF